jgi:PEP-CTERM motif
MSCSSWKEKEMERLSRFPAGSSPRRRTLLTHLALLALLSGAATSSNAGLITSNSGASESGLGSFTGTIGVTNKTATTATITVVLTNTSPAANGGFITAFAFNDPGTAGGGDIANVASFSATDPDGGGSGVAFTLLGGPTSADSINASPFGSFSIGASIPGGDFQGGGGSPNQGIGVGESATFTFDVTGTGLLNLSPASLEAALASGSGGRDSFFIVRFRGFADGGSDKVPAVATPEPSTLALGGIGLVGLGLGYVRRRRRAA